MRVLRSLGALLVLLAVVVGAPWLLWQVGREIMPDRSPSWADIWSALTERDTGTLFVGMLVLVGAIAWLIFTVCVVLEVVARIGGRKSAWRIPGLRVPQGLATGMISTIVAGLVAFGGQSTAMASAPTRHHQGPAVVQQHHAAAPAATDAVGQKGKVSPTAAAAARPETPASAKAPSSTVRAAGPTVVVQQGDSLWRLAEKHLGDPLRYKEIADLNIGRVQADGGVLRSAEQWLDSGWALTLPAGAHGATTPAAAAAKSQSSVVVQAGDTLTGIAQRELGDADRYLELAQLNRIADPDEIEIGQKILLPAPAAAAHPVAPAHPTASADQKAAAEKAASAHRAEAQKAAAEKAAAAHRVELEKAAAEKAAAMHQAQVQKAAAEKAAAAHRAEVQKAAAEKTAAAHQAEVQEAATDVAAAAAAAVVPAALYEASTEQEAPAPAPVGQNTTAAADAPAASSEDSSTMRTIGLGAVTASVLWGALLMRRRRQSMRRKLGQQPAPASLPAARVERQIRQQASGADVERLEQTLRTISTLSSDDGVLPDVRSAWLSSEGLHLKLAAAAEPPSGIPFEVTGSDWWLPAEADLPQVDWTEAVAPYPALASIGADDGESVLVDLEQLGAVRVSGDALRVQHLYNHLAVELAHSTWSDELTVSLVGWGADLVALAPERVVYEPDLRAVVDRMRTRIERTRESEQALETSVLGGRIGDIAGDIWSPLVLLVAPAAAQDQRLVAELDAVLAEMVGQGRSTVAVIAAADAGQLPAAVDLSIDSDGWLSCPAVLGEQRIRAAGVEEQLLERLVELIAGIEVQEAAPPAADPEPWAVGMAVSGALLEPEAAAVPATPGLDRTAVEVPAAAAGELELAVEDETVDEQEVEPEVPTRAPAAAVQLREVTPQIAALLESVLTSDPTLDADLAEWHSEEVTRPRVAILGPPEARTSGESKGRLERCTEIAVYMALYRTVTTDKFQTDLWAQDDQPSPGTRRWWLSTLRTWLGSDEDGRKYLAEARRGVQQLTDRLLDVELMRRLRKRGEAWAAAGDAPRAYQDLQAAMGLVRGPVLHQAQPGRYAFLSNPDRGEDHLTPLWVVQIAHETVDLALQLGDLDGARAAAEMAHLVAPTEDAPLTDLVRIAQTAGRQMEAREWATKILREHYSAQYIEDIENTETMLELSRLFPDGLQAS